MVEVVVVGKGRDCVGLDVNGNVCVCAGVEQKLVSIVGFGCWSRILLGYVG